MNPLTATFTQRDSYEGELESPLTQNRYLYAGGNPVMYSDPSGNTFLEVMAAFSMMDIFRYSMIAVGVYAAAQAGTLMLKAMVSTIEFNGLGNQFVHWLREIFLKISLEDLRSRKRISRFLWRMRLLRGLLLI